MLLIDACNKVINLVSGCQNVYYIIYEMKMYNDKLKIVINDEILNQLNIIMKYILMMVNKEQKIR